MINLQQSFFSGMRHVKKKDGWKGYRAYDNLMTIRTIRTNRPTSSMVRNEAYAHDPKADTATETETETDAKAQTTNKADDSSAILFPLGRTDYTYNCEEALNRLINDNYLLSILYHSMSTHFGHESVALPGLERYFKMASDQTRKDVQGLMDYQNVRGGRVRILLSAQPPSSFSSKAPGKPDGLEAMEQALIAEKVRFSRFNRLSMMAFRCGDLSLALFIQNMFVSKQIHLIKDRVDMATRMRKVGDGEGLILFDSALLSYLSENVKRM